MRALLPLFLLPLLAGCASTAPTPSLAPRPAEAIDPRLRVPDLSSSVPADPALGQRLAELVSQAEAATGAFNEAAARAEQLAASAGAPQSESWIAAQQALSAAIAERYPVTRAMGDLDTLTAARVRERGGISVADQRQISEASARIGAIDAAQATRLDALQQRLGG